MAFWRTSRGNDAEQDRGIETDLRDTLARVEQIKPTWKTEQYERRPVSRNYNDRDRTGEELYYAELEDKFLDSDGDVPFAVETQRRLS